MTTDLFGLLSTSEVILLSEGMSTIAIAAGFLSVRLRICLSGGKAGQKMTYIFSIYKLIWNTRGTELFHAEHTTHQPPPSCRSISQHTQSLFLGASHSLSHGLLNSLTAHLFLSRREDKTDQLSKSEGSPSRRRLRGFGVPIHRK